MGTAYYLQEVSLMPVWMKTAQATNPSTAVTTDPDFHRITRQELQKERITQLKNFQAQVTCGSATPLQNHTKQPHMWAGVS